MANKISPALVAITPSELFLQRVGTTFDNVRKTNAGYNYTPIQFGGIFGQIAVLEQSTVLELTPFEVS